MEEMCMTPKSLKSQCLNYVSDNIKDVFTHDTYIPMELSEALLTSLSLKNLINNKTLSYFSCENVHLRTFVLPMINCVTKKGLLILKTHKVKRIEVHSLNCRIDKLIDLLNTWTINNLEILNVSNMYMESPLEVSRDLVSSSLVKLKNLRSLNVSKTLFNNNHLVAIVENLPHLEALNISCTDVDNLLPLEKIKNKLKILSVYNLRKALTKMIDFAPLRCMTSLTHLDLSLDVCELVPFSYKSLLTDPYWLPNLVALDISGSESVGQKVWEDFLTNHKNIQFLGLMYMNDSSEKIFNIPSHPFYKMDLMITGSKNKSQLLLSVKMYPDRPTYIHTCLYYIRRITENNNFETPDIEFITVVLDMMKCFHYDDLALMLGTNCLYNLTKNHLALKIHPSILSSVVDTLLNVAENCFCVKPIQENTFLVLNNKNLLNSVKMDNVRCAKLVLKALQFSNANSTMIALFSKIAIKMSVYEISRIKLNYRSILIFIAVVSEKLSNLTIDSDMKCSINALWSLTDESPPSCELFIKLDGLQIFMILLNKFIDYSSLEGKVLKVFINISKIPHLRTKLLNDSIFPAFRRLLQSKNVKVSYRAAEIIAHLACVPSWETYILGDKTEILNELRFAVNEWATPKKIILPYRSFQSFNDLFNLTDSTQVQLWAAWAIFHACTNGKNYCVMLDKDIGMHNFKNISSNKSFDPEVRELCDRTTNLIKYLK